MKDAAAKKISAYQAVYGKIKNDIVKKIYNIGDLLPPEPKLEQMYGVSRTTVRKAVEMLAKDGVVFVRQGRGTVVTEQNIRQNYNYVSSFTETLKQKGYAVSVSNIAVSNEKADSETSSALGIEIETPVICINRIVSANGRPVSIIKNYLPANLLPDIALFKDEILSLYMFLENKYGIAIDSAHDRITARSATFEQSCILECEMNSALLFTRRITYRNNAPVSYDVVYTIADIYEIDISLHGRSD